MGRGGRGGHQPPRRTVDLTGVVSPTEKSDLVILVTALTEKMYRQINNLFDSPPVPPMSGEGRHRNWLSLGLRQHETNEKENKAPPVTFANRPVRPPTKQLSIHDSDSDDGLPTQLQELKKEAIAFFRKWQASVLQRLRDLAVTVVEDEIPPRGRGRAYRGAPRGRGGRGGRTNGRGSAPVPNGTDLNHAMNIQYLPC